MHKKTALSLVLVSLVLGAGCLDADVSDPKGNAGRVSRGGTVGTAPEMPTFVAKTLDGREVDPSLLLDVPSLVGTSRYIGHQSYEPTLGIHPKTGTIFMSGLTFGGPGSIGGLPVSSILRSKDQGATWTNVMPKLPAGGYHNPPMTFDPFVITDPITGRVFSADLYALVCNYLLFSDDEGQSWTANPIGCGHPVGVHDHQSIITGKARSTPTVGYPSMVYYCVNRVGDSSCAASNNGGLSFGPLVPVMLGVDVEAGGFCGGLHAHVKTDNSGRVLLPKAQCGVPSVGISEDDGRTWNVYKISPTKRIRGGDHEVAMTADAKDNLYALWIADDGLPYLSMSKNNGRTWTPAKNIAPPGVTAADKPAIHASAEGKVAMAYIGTTHPKGYATQDWTGATWNGYVSIILDGTAENPIVLTTTANDPADPIAINRCGGTRCQGVYDFIDVEIDPSGRPWAAFVDVCFERCIADFAKDPASARHDGNAGFMGTLDGGPALSEAGGALPRLPEPMVPAKPA